jgi:hypothetical protein
MASRTGFATVVFAFFGDGIAEGDDAQAGFAGAFHGCNSSHKVTPWLFSKVKYIITSD